MKKIYELRATRKHYHYVMYSGYFINQNLNKGTITLIGRRYSEEKWNNGFRIVYNYKYLCRDCGWDFISKNTFNRAGSKTIQCPNCGYDHLPDGTVLVNSEDKIVPVYYTIVLYSTNEKLILKMMYKEGNTEKDKWEAIESINFDFINQETEWQKKNIRTGITCSRKIGYLDEDFSDVSGFSCLTMDSQDDNGHSVMELCEVLSAELIHRMKKYHGAKAKALIVKSPDRRKAFFDTLLKLAHYTRFSGAPDARLYSRYKSLEDWYRDNNIYYKEYYGFEYKVEELMRSSDLAYCDAALKFFSIPETSCLKKYFSYKNIGLYMLITKRYLDQNLVEMLFSYAVKLSSVKSTVCSNSSSMQQIFLSCIDVVLQKCPKLPEDFCSEIVRSSFSFLEKIQSTEEYKTYIKQRKMDREDYIIKTFENTLVAEMVEKELQKQADLEKKNFYQVLCEKLSIPNTPILRKRYAFDLLKIYQKIYTAYENLQEANELVEMAFKVYSNTSYRQLEAVEALLNFYVIFKTYYPDVITPSYAYNYTLNPKNNPADCVRIFKSLNNESLQKFRTEKPRLKNLHDYLSILHDLQEHHELHYEIPEDVRRRTEMYLKNVKLSVLTKYSELLLAGKSLHNCAASYRNSITDKHYLVLATDDKGFPKALLEIRDEVIIQAKLMNNKPVYMDSNIQKIVKEFADKGNYKIETTDVQADSIITNKLAV